MNPTAGPCLPPYKHHAWGDEQRRSGGASASWYVQHCKRCPSVRIIEYTNRGNHVAGYEMRPAK